MVVVGRKIIITNGKERVTPNKEYTIVRYEEHFDDNKVDRVYWIYNDRGQLQTTYKGDFEFCKSTPIDTTSLDKEELLKQAKENAVKIHGWDSWNSYITSAIKLSTDEKESVINTIFEEYLRLCKGK